MRAAIADQQSHTGWRLSRRAWLWRASAAAAGSAVTTREGDSASLEQAIAMAAREAGAPR